MFLYLPFSLHKDHEESSPTNKEVLDKLTRRNHLEIATWLHQLLPESEQKCMLVNSIQMSLPKLKKRKDNYNRTRHRDESVAQEFNEFMGEKFVYPQPDLTLRGKRKQDEEPEKVEDGVSSEKTVEHLKQQLSMTETKLKRAWSSVDYRDCKIVKLEDQLETIKRHNEGEVGDHRSCLQPIEELKEQVKQLQEANKVLEDKLKVMINASRSAQIETTKVDPQTRKVCCTENMVKCVYACQEHHVGSTHISPVIDSVLKTMTGKSCSSLPSKSTIQGWNITRLSLAQRQIAE